MNTFTYEPLEPGHMRLLRLQPGPGWSELRATLIPVSFQNAPKHQYQALSYSWGEDKRKLYSLGLVTEISDGCRSWHTTYSLGITRSLRDALQHLRDSERSRFLWIDAICINQADQEELSTQVERMYAVYSMAESTIIWLGPEPDERAFYFILEVSRYFQTQNDNKDLPQNSQFEHLWLCKFIDACYPRFRGCTQSLFAQWHHENRVAFLSLVSETGWFQRAWVFQEGVASKHKILQQGSFAISWDSFSYACKLIREGEDGERFSSLGPVWVELIHRTSKDCDGELPKPARLASSAAPQRCHFQVFGLVQKMDDARSAIDDPSQKFGRNRLLRPLLRNLLPVARHMKCMKPRDKVFSLLNVDKECRSREGTTGNLITPEHPTSTREGRVFPTIDYTDKMSDEQVCLDVTKYWLGTSAGGGSERLVFLQHVQDERRDRWPSWLPDWSMEHRAGIFTRKPHHYNQRGPFHASGESQVAVSITTIHDGNREIPVLRACGLLIEELGIAKIEPRSRRSSKIGDLLKNYKRGKHPGTRISYQKAVNELAGYIDTPYTAQSPTAGTSARNKFDLSNIWRSTAYVDRGRFIRKFFVLQRGYIGLAPLRAEVDDEICILFGARTPLAVRRKGEYYEFIGERLVCGVMDGELMKNLDSNKVENLEFR